MDHLHLPTLLVRLQSDDEDERMAAVQALDALDDSRTIEPLGRVVLDSGEDTMVRREALLALGDFGPEADELISMALHSNSSVVRDEARLLVRQRQPQ